MTASTPKAIIGVIDDDELVRDSLKALLETHRYAVSDFDSARSFLQRIGSDDIACLVLDVHMPDMTGLELLRQLRRSGNAMPVVLITGRGDPSMQAEAAALGAIAMLDKPVAHTALFAAIDRALAA